MASLAAAFTHYIYGGLQLPGPGADHPAALRAPVGPRRGCSLVRAAWLLARAATRCRPPTRDLITGITYTDAHAVLPTKAILAVAAVICAAAVPRRRSGPQTWRLPLVGVVGLLVVLAVVVGGIYPALVQSLKVKPSREVPGGAVHPAQHRRHPRGLRARRRQDAPPTRHDRRDPGQLRDRRRRRSPASGSSTPTSSRRPSGSSQARASYYAFPDTLDVDRYTIDGTTRDAVVAVREMDLDGVPDGQRNWLNDHTVYTHGYGFVAAYGNRSATAEGDPVFFEQRHRHHRRLTASYEPRIYFGEQLARATRSSAAPRAAPREFDYPDGGSAGGQTNNTYAGTGGVPIGLLLSKLAYADQVPRAQLPALRRGQRRVARSSTTARPRERVQRVAPWLTLDGNVYPAVVDGRVAVDRRRLHDDRRTTPTAGTSTSRTRPRTRSPRHSHGRHGVERPARSTTSATRSRPPSTPTTAR